MIRARGFYRLFGSVFRRETGRFFVVGFFNTLVGYFVGVGAYLLLTPFLHLVVISLLASVLSIVISFVNQRVFVFRSSDPWWPQLRRSFMVYGAISVVGTALLWPLLKVVGLSIWLAQGIVLVACTALSYAGQIWFTFRRNIVG